jgi:methionyl-tRNA synthetase
VNTKNAKIFYETAAIDYANAAPHIGHVYEKVVADYLARFHRLDGYDTNFVTGTDEHGEKIARAAKNVGKDPQSFVDYVSEELFQPAYEQLQIAHDDYIRTTSQRHRDFVQQVLQKVYDAGDIYYAEYEGLYSVGSERFVTEKELVNGILPGDSEAPVVRKEANYFFRMEKYRDWLVEYLHQNPDLIQPTAYRNEVLEMLKEPIGDLSISRPIDRISWGIPIPWDTAHVTYVWFDALLAYISSLASRDLLHYWPQAWHVIGKDILKPHAIFWPTMLKSAGFPIYKRLVVHGHILAADGRKMGKSLGNAINPLELASRFGVDVLHYALLRETTLGSDTPFGEETIIQRLNADLANDLGNLLSRVRTMLLKYCEGKIPAPSPSNPVALQGIALADKVRKEVSNLRIHLAIEEVLQYVRSLNKFVNDQKPWELAKDPSNQQKLEDVLYTATEGLRIASVLLEPSLPNKAVELRRALGLGDYTVEQTQTWGLSPAGALVPAQAPILFPKEEITVQEVTPTNTQEAAQNLIAIDEFAKVELVVAEVLKCEKHPKADKLLVLSLSLGDHTRQVVSGIAQHYTPESLIGKKLIVVANLKPALLRGIESQGMILAGESEGKIVVVTPEESLPAGTKIK